MSTRKMTNQGARAFAGLLASIGPETNKAMQPILQGKRDAQDALPLFRRIVKKYLGDKDLAARLKPTVHAKLTEWAATYGLQTKGDEVFTVRRVVRMTEELNAEILAAVGGDEAKVAEFLRQAAKLKLRSEAA